MSDGPKCQEGGGVRGMPSPYTRKPNGNPPENFNMQYVSRRAESTSSVMSPSRAGGYHRHQPTV